MRTNVFTGFINGSEVTSLIDFNHFSSLLCTRKMMNTAASSYISFFCVKDVYSLTHEECVF